MNKSLQEAFEELHESRKASWSAEDLKVNVDQRKELVRAFDWDRAVKTGDIVPNYTLLDVESGAFDVSELVQNGAAVLIFFRHAACPACNVALPYYEQHLLPKLNELGVPLVMISAQVPQSLRDIKERHGLKMRVASDKDNEMARHLGITFMCNEASQEYYSRAEWALPERMGTGTWELPHPTALVLDKDRRVLFADVAPDWLRRTEPGRILAAVPKPANAVHGNKGDIRGAQ